MALFGNLAWGKEHFSMKNPHGTTLTVDLAITQKEHAQGLSGLRPDQFKSGQGMLFINSSMGPRRFWMPDTYFNLDIIFLDNELRIVAIDRNVPAHPGMKEPPTIYKTETYSAQFVLEIKAASSFGVKLKTGDKLIFTGSTSLSEIISKIHQKQ